MIRWICIEDSWLDPSFICWNHISLLLKRLSPSKNIPRNSLFLTISKVMILSSFVKKRDFFWPASQLCWKCILWWGIRGPSIPCVYLRARFIIFFMHTWEGMYVHKHSGCPLGHPSTNSDPSGPLGCPSGIPFPRPCGPRVMFRPNLSHLGMRARRASNSQVNGRCEPEGWVSAYTSEEPKVPSATLDI